MSSWLVLLAACALPTQVPDTSVFARPKPTIVKLDEYDKEVERLRQRATKLHYDVDYLEAQLAKKKAEAQTADADVTLYVLTHDVEATKSSPAEATEPSASRRPIANDQYVPVTKGASDDHPPLIGRVVDAEGKPMAGVAITLEKVDIDKLQNDRACQNFASVLCVAGRAKTDANGEYALAVEPQPQGMPQAIKYEAPGHARLVVTTKEHGDKKRRLIKLERGVSLGGTIVHKGAPIPNVKVYLLPKDMTWPDGLGYWLATTDEKGLFVFENLPADLDADLHFDTDTLKHLGAIATKKVKTLSLNQPGSSLGPIEVGSSPKVTGRVVFADGTKVPAGSRLWIANQVGIANQVVKLDVDGRFEVKGMPPGKVSLGVVFPNQTQALTSYRLSAQNVSLDHSLPNVLTGRLDRDINDLAILYEPGSPWATTSESNSFASLGFRLPNTETLQTEEADHDKVPLTGVRPAQAQPKK